MQMLNRTLGKHCFQKHHAIRNILQTSKHAKGTLKGLLGLNLQQNYFVSLVASSSSETVVSVVSDVGYQVVSEHQPILNAPPTYVTASGRIVAIGDLHGDMRKTIRSLRLAGVLMFNGNQPLWCGKDTVVVQLGDVLDRGDYEIAIVMLLRELDRQARLDGGAVYMLNGNHESLNVCGDFRYVTEGAFLESSLAAGLTPEEAENLELRREARSALYCPGGPMAIEFSKNPTVLVINDTAFVHGGLLPIHAKYGVERMNKEVAAWMRAESNEDGGKAMPPYLAMGDGKSVMWNRTLSRETFSTPTEKFQACNALSQALELIKAKRLVVGHTPQLGGCNCECGGKVWRIDVGMSSGVLDANVQILEIRGAPRKEPEVRILTESSAYSTWSDDDDEFLSDF